MPRGRLALFTVVAIAGAFVATGAQSGGAATSPSLTADPTHGPAGTTILVSGTACPDPSWDTSLTWRVHVQIQPPGSAPATGEVTPPSGTPTTPIGFTAEGYPGRADATATPAADGTWSTQVTIPDSGPLAAVPGTYPIGALCYAIEGAEAGTIVYPAQTFTVPPPSAPPSPPRAIVTHPALTG
jgi:hypothetical protein